MPFLNSDTPSLSVFVRNEFLFNQESGYGEVTEGWLVSVRSVQAQAFQFTVLLNNGVLFTGLPVNALCFYKDSPKQALDIQQLWDAQSYDLSVFEMKFLKNMSCEVFLKNKTTVKATYCFSIDSCSYSGTYPGLSETPNEWKVHHFLKAEDGNFYLYPQNRIKFLDASLIVNQDVSKLGYKVNKVKWVAETGNKWNVSDIDDYLYIEKAK